MARSRSPRAERDSSEVAESLIEIDGASSDAVSTRSPMLPSSVERTFAPGPLPPFWIELPPRPPNYNEYHLINPPPLPRAPTPELGDDDDDDESDVPVKLVGEAKEKGQRFYFAEFDSGVIHRIPKDAVQAKYPNLVKTYNRRLEEDTLSDFDPSSVRVRPQDRQPVTVRLDLSKTRKMKKYSSRSASARSSTTKNSSRDDSPVVISSDDSDSEHVPARHSTRLASRPQAQRSNGPPTRTLRSGGKPDDPSSDTGVDSGSEYSVDDGDDSSSSEKKGLKIKMKRSHRPAREVVKGLGSLRDMAENEEESGSEQPEDDRGHVYLRRHRPTCDRCGERPAHIQLAAYEKRMKRGKPGRKKKKTDQDDESEDEEERLERLGGWIRCLHCCTSKHWGCLSVPEKLDVQLAVRKVETEIRDNHKRERGWDVPENGPMVEKIKAVWLDQTTEYACDMCTRGAPCFVCGQDTSPAGPALAPVDPPPSLQGGSGVEDAIDLTTPPPEVSTAVQPATPTDSIKAPSTAKPSEVHLSYADQRFPQVLFRCIRCRRPAHWQHVPPRDPNDPSRGLAMHNAEIIQSGPDAWKCNDCVRWVNPAEAILAWRPDGSGVPDNIEPGTVPNIKDPLRREYLVKFRDRGFKRVEWVPHFWLVSMQGGLLRNFLKSGTKLSLLEDESEEFQEKMGKLERSERRRGKLEVFARSRSVSADADAKGGEPDYEGTPGPLPDAELRIPSSWLRIDRILDIRLRLPARVSKAKKKPAKPKGKKAKSSKKKRVIESDLEDEIESDSEEAEPAVEFLDGQEPSEDQVESPVEFEMRTGLLPDEDEIRERAVWVFTKFEGLQYDECSWDTPPQRGSPEWDSYIHAISRYVFARSVEVTKLTRSEEAKRDGRTKRSLAYWSKLDWQPELDDKSLSLMPFQVQGLQWLYGNWYNLQPSILADDMGLGKTVQLVCLIGKLVNENVFPHLIVVPNSTIVNWIREFERWAPHVRAVQFNGDAKARQVIKEYELSNPDGRQMYHAIVTTYETLHGVEFGPVFKKPGRWEVLVVDEGQRLKSDSSLLFRKLKELNTVHRILMTGTPLNNNIRELFNLMNFLDPDEWNDLDALEKEFDQENLTEELLVRLHERLRPYFLRRQKAEVLDLPDKHEVIVPVSLAPIQKDIMRAIIEANLSALGLFAAKDERETRKTSKPKKASLNNALMEMRKCIQHPYLNEPDIERRGLTGEETLKQLVDASAKFRLLQKLLPVLKKRGHRVLLFSQFKIVLDIIEDFINMEGYKMLRLDGDTKSVLRQKEIDQFNKPGSDYFIYILTTRAGGVGVNLWSADTVIVFDPDFNPHQDLQAIARAHRYGQKKRVLVFKFMGKGTPEEKMFMMGKKKLVLDHLIVQKLGDEDEMDDIQGILTYGAKALFENPGESVSDIKYTDHDVEQLVTRAETEVVEEKKSADGGMKFDFAQVWDRAKGGTTDIEEEVQSAGADDDFWANVIKRAAEEKAQKRAQELTGRGARKRAITNYNEVDLMLDGSPEKKPKGAKTKSGLSSKSGSDHDDFKPPGHEESSSDDETGATGSEDHAALSGFPVELGPQFPGGSMAGPNPSASRSNFAIPLQYTENSMPAVPQMPSEPIPKPKKPRKPRVKKPTTSASDVPPAPTGAPNQPSGDPLKFDPSPYSCHLCYKVHCIGQCALNSNIMLDKLLQTRSQIMDPRNADAETHKYWALQFIDKKLSVDYGIDVSRLPAHHFSADILSKGKAPRTSVASTSKTNNSGITKPGASLATGSSSSRVSGVVGSSSLKVASDGQKPKKKSVAQPSGPPAGIPGPYRPPAPPAVPSLRVHPPPIQESSGAAVQSNRHFAPAGTLDRTHNAADRLGSRVVHVPVPSTATAKPKFTQPIARSPSFSPPPIQHVVSSVTAPTPSSSSSVPAKKRQATGQPEEPRKKQATTCIICGQKPGHKAYECPQIRSTEGLRAAIQKIEQLGGNEVMLATLRRMLSRREQPV